MILEYEEFSSFFKERVNQTELFQNCAFKREKKSTGKQISLF